QLLERDARLMNPRQIRSETIEAVPRRFLQKDLRKPDDRTNRRAEVLADMGEQSALQPPIRMRLGRCRHACFRVLLPVPETSGFRCFFDRARPTFFRGGVESRLAWYRNCPNRHRALFRVY